MKKNKLTIYITQDGKTKTMGIVLNPRRPDEIKRYLEIFFLLPFEHFPETREFRAESSDQKIVAIYGDDHG